jgi:hypothetical protein
MTLEGPVGSTLSLTVAWLVLGLNPPEHIVSDHVDVIEINHFYDEHGKLVFDQVLYYDWSPAQSRYNVRAWRLLKTPAQIPRRDVERGDYVATWYDGESMRQIRATTVRESWTQYDPELVEREHLPKERRKELRNLYSARKHIEAMVVASEPRSTQPVTSSP